MSKKIIKILMIIICMTLILTACTSIDNSSSEQTSSEDTSSEQKSNEENNDGIDTLEEDEMETPVNNQDDEEQTTQTTTAAVVDYAKYFQTAEYDNIKDTLGALVRTEPDEMNDYTNYIHEDVSISVDANGTIQTITLHENAPTNYELNGIATGMKQSEVIALLGEPFSEDDETDNPAISYEIDINGGTAGFKLYFNSSDRVISAVLMNYTPNGMLSE